MSLVSGHSKLIYELAVELAKKGHEITMISTKLYSEEAEKHSLLIVKYPELKQVNFVEISKLTWRNLQQIGADRLLEQCDVIHVCTPTLNLIHYLTKKFPDRVVRQIVSDYITLKDIYITGIGIFAHFVSHYPRKLIQVIHKFFYKAIGEKCTAILCSTNYMRERLLKLGLAPQKLQYVPFGVHVARAFVKGQMDMTDRLVYMYFGWLSPMRGIPNLVKAFAIVKSAEPKAELIIANPGGHLEEDAMIQLINRSVVARSITVIPWQKDIDPFIQSAIAVVLPFQGTMGYSQPPLTVTEAMSLGKAVISTKKGSINELIVDGKTGLLVEPGDVEGLARAMLRLSDKTFAEKIGENAYEEIKKKHNWDTVIDKYLEVYNSIYKQNYQANIR